jgi:hypothetical protein
MECRERLWGSAHLAEGAASAEHRRVTGRPGKDCCDVLHVDVVTVEHGSLHKVPASIEARVAGAGAEAPDRRNETQDILDVELARARSGVESVRGPACA